MYYMKFKFCSKLVPVKRRVAHCSSCHLDNYSSYN